MIAKSGETFRTVVRELPCKYFQLAKKIPLPPIYHVISSV